MEMDLHPMQNLTHEEYETYIYGSAEVVDLMCLYVFIKGDAQQFEQLKASAQRFGAALQKVNFLRDIQADFEGLNRIYFPNVDFSQFTSTDKQKIEADIEEDFRVALQGIKQLALTSRFAVYLAYKYYYKLFKKIKNTQPEHILQARIRVNDFQKSLIFLRVFVKRQLMTLFL